MNQAVELELQVSALKRGKTRVSWSLWNGVISIQGWQTGATFFSKWERGVSQKVMQGQKCHTPPYNKKLKNSAFGLDHGSSYFLRLTRVAVPLYLKIIG